MRYFWALVMPPLAVLLCSKPVQTVLNVILTFCLVIPGQIHAVFVVHNHLAEQRTQRVVTALQQRRA